MCCLYCLIWVYNLIMNRQPHVYETSFSDISTEKVVLQQKPLPGKTTVWICQNKNNFFLIRQPLYLQLVSALVILFERRYGFITSGILFIYWLLQLIAGIVIFQSKVKEATRDVSRLCFVRRLFHTFPL